MSSTRQPTLVTAFFDIKREHWDNCHKRSVEKYKQYIRRLYEIPVKMVIFTEPALVETLTQYRSMHPAELTTFIVEPINRIKGYGYKKQFREIMINSPYIKAHPAQIAPEVSKYMYNVVVLSKVDFLLRASQLFPDTEYMFWIDSGFGHGKYDYSKNKWNPTSLMIPGKIVVNRLVTDVTPDPDPIKFFLQYIDVIGGGTFGGDTKMFKTLHTMYYDLVEEMIERQIVDDDQYFMTLLLMSHPEMFHESKNNGWFGIMNRT